MRTDAEKRDSGDYFRPLADVNEPDPRWKGMVRYDERGMCPITLDDLHASIAELELCEAVPEDVSVQFDTARNLLLYSWYAYRLIPVAELQAYRTVELALRRRFGVDGAIKAKGKKPMLGELLTRAVREGFLKDERFRQHRRARELRQEYKEAMQQLEGGTPIELPGDVQAYAKQLADAMPALRNHLAHGGCMLHPGGRLTLEICCDVINQLFC